MKWHKPPQHQWLGFLFSMPFICWALNSILFGAEFYYDWRIWALSFPLIFILGLGSWFLHYQYDYWTKSKFPDLSQTPKRVFINLFVNLFIMSPSVIIILFIYHYFHILGYRLKTDDLKWFLVVGLIVNVIFETLWEVIYIIDKYKETLTDQEMLRQMSIEQEFDNLKSQVNPHFLFNCFNTLSSLISENKEMAEHFLDELSKVYRYLLNNHKDSVATLQNEVKFIESYMNLLKTRHGDALEVQMNIDKKFNSYLLPSLSLQLLVENAVKHNIVSKSQPLRIEIFTTPAMQLVVNNNLQRKQIKEKSTRIGLKNIRSKYQLMNENGFQIVEGETNFMAVLPLVKNKPVVSA